jgi:hypothetical protein
VNLRNIFLIFCFLNLPQLVTAEEVTKPASTEQSPTPTTLETAPPSTPPTTPTASTPSTTDEKSNKSWGRLGLSAALTAPHIIEYGLDYFTPDNMFSSSFVVGGYTFKTGTVSAGISSYDLRGRWHPFMGSFFLGLAYGSQKISIEAKDVVNTFDTIVKLDIKSAYVMPHLGWFAAWDSGFTLGFELGMIMPSGVSSSLTTDIPAASASQRAAIEATNDYIKMKTDAESAGDKLGKTSIPYLTLLKLGWVF